MSKTFVLLVILAVLLFAQTDAHKSVRIMKPQTEEERETLHVMHRNMHHEPELEDAPDPDMDDPETSKLLYKSPSYHFAWGPEYPHHDTVEYKAEEQWFDGELIPDFISEDELKENYY